MIPPSLPTNVRELREYIKTKSQVRIQHIMKLAGVSDEEATLLLLRYKKKYNVEKVAYLKNTNISSVSRKCSRGMKQLLDFINFCSKFEQNLDIF